MIRFTVLLCIALSTILVTSLFAESSGWFFGAMSLITGILWFWGELRDIKQTAAPGMICMIFLSAVLGMYGTAAIILACVVVLALSAWDLSRLRHRMVYAVSKDIRTTIEKKHLCRLLVAECIGIVPVLIYNKISFHISFVTFLALGGLLQGAIFMIAKLNGSDNNTG